MEFESYFSMAKEILDFGIAEDTHALQSSAKGEKQYKPGWLGKGFAVVPQCCGSGILCLFDPGNLDG
jgi:hypothetical protein